MKNLYILFLLFILSNPFQLEAQCISGTSFISFSVAPYTVDCDQDPIRTILTNAWTDEYSTINDLEIGGSYEFTSSVSTDYFTLTDGSDNILIHGLTPLTYTNATVTTVRLHRSKSINDCSRERVLRTNTVECLTCSTPPPPIQQNATCSGAISFSLGEGGSISGNTSGSCPDPSLDRCGTSLNSASGLWYKFTSPKNGEITVDLCGSPFDTKLGIFAGDCSTLNCIDGDDDTSSVCGPGADPSVTITATANTTYLVYVTGFGSQAGEFTLNYTGFPPEPIPTMNEWGLMIFGLLLLNLGILFIYKQQAFLTKI